VTGRLSGSLVLYISSVHAFIAVMQYVEHVLETVSRILCVSGMHSLIYFVLLMSTLHASVCMHVPANILMLTLHMLIASGLSYTRTSTCIRSMAVLLMSTFCMRQCVKMSLVYTDVTSHITH
jgi:hypothetical protein